MCMNYVYMYKGRREEECGEAWWTTSQRSTVDHKGVWYVSCLQYKHICILCIRIYILYIGFSKSTVKRILNEYEKLGDGEEFESPAKRYKVSRTKILRSMCYTSYNSSDALRKEICDCGKFAGRAS